MNEIITFAQTISPIGVIAILVIIIFQLLRGNNWLSGIRKTQQEKYPELEEMFTRIVTELNQANTVATNHTHNLPDMYESQKRIEEKMDKANDTLIRIETKL